MKIYFGYQVDLVMAEKEAVIQELKRQIARLEQKLEVKEKELSIAVDNALRKAGERGVSVSIPVPRTKDVADVDVASLFKSIGGDTTDPMEKATLREIEIHARP